MPQGWYRSCYIMSRCCPLQTDFCFVPTFFVSFQCSRESHIEQGCDWFIWVSGWGRPTAMFDLCEWNDNSEAQSLTECLARNPQGAAKKDKAALSRRKRTKRNRELLDILHSLEPPDNRQQHPHTPGALTSRALSDGATEPPDCSPDAPLPAVCPALPPEPRLSRKQWRNKQKSQKRQKNKFKPSSECSRGGVERTGGAGEPQPGYGGEKRGASVQSGTAGQQKPTEMLGGPEETVAAKRARPEPITAGSAHVGSAVAPGDKPGALLQKRSVQKLKKMMQRGGQLSEAGATSTEGPELLAEEDPVGESAPSDRSSSLRSRMEERLSSARFRYINQQLYTSDSHEALRLFQNDPEAFTVYHKGFSQQVQHWPVSPLAQIIKYIKNRPPSLVVADFGCGDALIARSVRNTVHSFDLVALNDHVTVCDMAKVPLSDETVDIAVFCLSLMGKNIGEFLQEANRVLTPGGVLLLAEVSSRFDDIRQFLSAMSQLRI
ncbi:hypothetical protein XENTR_v10007499 [Xenopus tropicalis]|nr:hypothetical protein XENTR_v10007499 [Xenopus tropicalis]